MKTLECGCELSPGGKLVSVCALHGEHVQAAQELTRHPRANAPEKELRDRLLAASMPTACERMARKDKVDTVAEDIVNLVYQIQRRLE